MLPWQRCVRGSTTGMGVKPMKIKTVFFCFLMIAVVLNSGAGWTDPAAPAATGVEQAAVSASRVDFSYAFSTPHRMTAARPDSSDKTLLDLEPGSLKLVWTYDNLLNLPLAAFVTPTASWGVKLTPRIAGTPFPQSRWSRMEGYLPALDNGYDEPRGTMRLEVVGGGAAAMVRVTMANTGTDIVRFSLLCESQRGFFGYNPGYVDPVRDRDCLLAGWGDRADRVLVLAVGADECVIMGPTQLCPAWDLQPGETRTAWLIRPYRGYAADLPTLREFDWQKDFDVALTEWRELLARAVRVSLPDPGVVNAFYACLGDLFIMREPVAEGYIAATPGTDGYRAPNAGEASIVAVALDQMGLHRESALGYQMCIDQQGDDGDWADPKGWSHLCWLSSGFKSWAIMEHFRLTGDRAYLESAYPRMAKSSRFQEKMRARTRVEKDGTRPLEYGLMPRGMGDCGLKDGDDLYGVFVPNNIWSVYADKLTVEAARILGHTGDIDEFQKIYETAARDLTDAMNRGAISELEYRWIPGVLGKTSGSRWGALNALFPCGLLSADNELVTGTIRHIRSNMSPGGLPMNTGWLANGMWVAIALDNLAEVHLVRNEGDEAAALLYATLNHATPLITWCEERGPEPGAKEVTGDRQHLWTPVAVVREVRDSLVMEQGNTLCLARGIDRDWLADGKSVGITDAPTHWGRVSYEVKYDAAAGKLTGKIVLGEQPDGAAPLTSVTLQARLPQPLRLASVNGESGAVILADGSALQWPAFTGERSFEAAVN